MKKILLLISFIFLMSIPINVFAEDTAKATCVYGDASTAVKLTLNITDKITTSFKINETPNSLPINFWGFTGKVNDFSKNGELFCKDKIYASINYSSSRQASYTFYPEETTTAFIVFNLNSNESSVYNPTKEKDTPPPTATVRKVDCSDFKDLTSPIWLWIRILAPILVIVLGGFDFFKVIAAGDEKEIKQSVNTFIKRLIILGILFMLPLLVNLVFGLVKGDITACLSDDFLGGNTNITEQDNTPDNNQDNDITKPRDQWKEEYDR